MIINLRTCCICRKSFPKSDLIRVVKTADGKIFIDKSGKASGRGAYICKKEDCKGKLKKLKSLNKAFKCQVSDEIYEELLKKEN